MPSSQLGHSHILLLLIVLSQEGELVLTTHLLIYTERIYVLQGPESSRRIIKTVE